VSKLQEYRLKELRQYGFTAEIYRGWTLLRNGGSISGRPRVFAFTVQCGYYNAARQISWRDVPEK
jgi:hypothetical protein